MAFIARFGRAHLSMVLLKLPGWPAMVAMADCCGVGRHDDHDRHENGPRALKGSGIGALQPFAREGEVQPHVAGTRAVFLSIWGVLLGDLHRHALQWLSGSSGAPARTGAAEPR